MKQLTSLMGNRQCLDGGAMFGNVPKALWSQWLPPNADNQVTLACRALLVQEADKTILLETGIGAFFPPHLKQRYGIVEDHHVLLASLEAVGVQPEAIDYVILSHLHFDHAGGLLSPWQANRSYQLLFSNAQYVVSAAAWQRALQPHPRDRASFIPELTQLLQQSQRLLLIDGESCCQLGGDYRFFISNGHTPGMLHTIIEMPQGPIVFAADLIPGIPWLHLPVTMGYDRFPELVIDEKQQLLAQLLPQNGRVFYTHDLDHAMSNVALDSKGRYVATNSVTHLTHLVE